MSMRNRTNQSRKNSTSTKVEFTNSEKRYKEPARFWSYENIVPTMSKHAFHVRCAIVVVGVSALVALVYTGMHWYAQMRNDRAYIAFNNDMHVYNRIDSAVDNQSLLNDLKNRFANDYQEHAHSAYAPYFLLYKSNLENMENDVATAYSTLHQGITLLTNPALIALYSTKAALMQLDSPDVVVQQKGIDSLQNLTQDVNNPFAHMALYFLGRYYFVHDQYVHARRVWQELVDQSRAEDFNQHQWAVQAQSYLDSFAR